MVGSTAYSFVEVCVHYRPLSPINQFRLADFTVEIVGNLIGNDLAADFHRANFTTACGLNRREISRARLRGVR